MQHLFYLLLLLAAISGGVAAWLHQKRTAQRVSEERDMIEVEERRLFGFIHGLAKNLQDDHSASSIRRYLVEGAVEVVGANAGILYLWDPVKNLLVPIYQTAGTTPVLPIPPDLVSESSDTLEGRYRNYLRLTSLTIEDPIIGKALSQRGLIQIRNAAQDPVFSSGSNLRFYEGTQILAAPLFHANKPVGVLAISRQQASPFTHNDCEVFESLAVQSALAIGNAAIHVEAAEKRRLERELMQASEIQRILLPKTAPALRDYELAAEYLPARHVSGDYYDYVPVDATHYGIAIGDVCGKGIAASLVMAMCRSNLRSRAPEILSPATVLHSVNHSIFPDIREDMFVSLLYLILERDSNEVIIARAGHELPLHRRAATGETEVVDSPGLAAGIDEGPVFQRSVRDHHLHMQRGDILLLYTDGVIERENEEGEEYGIERLRERLTQLGEHSARQVVDAIMADLTHFSGDRAQGDDITLIAIAKR